MSGKTSTKRMKQRLKQKKGTPEHRVGSWTTFKTSRHRKSPRPAKPKKKKNTTASESLQKIGERLGEVSVASQDEFDGSRDCDTDDPSEAASKIRKQASKYQ
jgi:hypothetical protein